MPASGRFILPLVLLMDELAGVVRLLSDDQYVQSGVGSHASCVGGHVRHVLDHVNALLGAVDSGTLDYDSRRRGTNIEADRSAALALISNVASGLLRVPDSTIDRPLALKLLMTASGPAVEVKSTVGREAAFVLSHTIHHNAMIGAIVKTLGVTPPERFGFAPATLALSVSQVATGQACAR